MVQHYHDDRINVLVTNGRGDTLTVSNFQALNNLLVDKRNICQVLFFCHPSDVYKNVTLIFGQLDKIHERIRNSYLTIVSLRIRDASIRISTGERTATTLYVVNDRPAAYNCLHLTVKHHTQLAPPQFPRHSLTKHVQLLYVRMYLNNFLLWQKKNYRKTCVIV